MTPAPRRLHPSSPAGTDSDGYESPSTTVITEPGRPIRTERRRLMCRERGRQHQIILSFRNVPIARISGDPVRRANRGSPIRRAPHGHKAKAEMTRPATRKPIF
jgi:hypothetical protein